MAEPKNWYLVCYDIRCSKRWRKAHKLIEGYGDRLQYSIFRCWLTQRTREKMRWQLEKILTKDDDLILIRLIVIFQEMLVKSFLNTCYD